MSGLRPVSTGTQKIAMNSSDRDYESQLRAAQAQADGNPYVAGIQEVFDRGAAEDVSESRDPRYGAVTRMPQEVLEGRRSNFAQDQSADNRPATDSVNRTGSLASGVSSTNIPQRDADEFQSDALEKKLAMYSGTMPANETLNDRSQTMRG